MMPPLPDPGPELTRHYVNVGRVAVWAAWVEEAAAGIVAAEEDDWDAERNLRFARSRPGLVRSLHQVGYEIGHLAHGTATGSGQSSLLEPVRLSSDIEDFCLRLESVMDERDKVVHAVVRTTLGSPTPELAHPRSMDGDATPDWQALPTDGEVHHLCFELNALAGDARHLAARVLAVLRHG